MSAKYYYSKITFISVGRVIQWQLGRGKCSTFKQICLWASTFQVDIESQCTWVCQRFFLMFRVSNKTNKNLFNLMFPLNYFKCRYILTTITFSSKLFSLWMYFKKHCTMIIKLVGFAEHWTKTRLYKFIFFESL